jgi:hypothetical protein
MEDIDLRDGVNFKSDLWLNECSLVAATPVLFLANK